MTGVQTCALPISYKFFSVFPEDGLVKVLVGLARISQGLNGGCMYLYLSVGVLVSIISSFSLCFSINEIIVKLFINRMHFLFPIKSE